MYHKSIFTANENVFHHPTLGFPSTNLFHELVLFRVEIIKSFLASPVVLEEHTLRLEIAVQPSLDNIQVLGYERVVSLLDIKGRHARP
jgi:hypothetical protein